MQNDIVKNTGLGSLAFASHNRWDKPSGYQDVEITDLKHLATAMNEGSVIGCSLRDGYRNNDNSLSSLYAMFIDIGMSPIN